MWLCISWAVGVVVTTCQHPTPANTKHLYNIYTTSAQRLRRWSNFVWMLYKCFVFAGTYLSYLWCVCVYSPLVSLAAFVKLLGVISTLSILALYHLQLRLLSLIPHIIYIYTHRPTYRYFIHICINYICWFHNLLCSYMHTILEKYKWKVAVNNILRYQCRFSVKASLFYHPIRKIFLFEFAADNI